MNEVWSPIQLIPQGLLGLLQIKNLGRNPDGLMSDIRPTFDILQFWYQTLAEELGGMTRVPATGSNGFGSWATPVIVPQGETWWVLNYTLTTDEMGVGDSGAFGLGWQLPVTNHPYAVGDISAANSGVGRCITHGEEFFVPPGGELLWYTNDVINATGFAVNAFARIVRLPL